MIDRLRYVLPWFFMVSIISSIDTLLRANYDNMQWFDYVLVVTSIVAIVTSSIAICVVWRNRKNA